MPAKIDFTPDAIADIRRRYLETDEPLVSILPDFGISAPTFTRLRRRERWPVRKKRSDVPASSKLLLEADKAVRDHIEGASDASPLSIADRLDRAAEKELASLEMRRTNLGVAAADPSDAERATRTIQRLTEILYKIRRLRLPDEIATDQVAASDRPKDIDEFRRRLKRRIDALRTGTGGEAPSGDAPVGDASA